jgi:hypothetical protein
VADLEEKAAVAKVQRIIAGDRGGQVLRGGRRRRGESGRGREDKRQEKGAEHGRTFA